MRDRNCSFYSRVCTGLRCIMYAGDSLITVLG